MPSNRYSANQLLKFFENESIINPMTSLKLTDINWMPRVTTYLNIKKHYY